MDSAFDVNEFIKYVAALIAVLNPIGVAPLLLSLTPGASARERAGVAAIASLTVFVTLVAAAWLGEEILLLFAISVDVFRMAGGLLILLTALSMIRPQATTAEPEATDKPRPNPGVVPLGIPLLAGPGAISTAIVFANHPHPQWGEAVAHGAGVTVASLVTLACLTAAVPCSG